MRRLPSRSILFCLLLLIGSLFFTGTLVRPARANDGMFPPAPAAKPFIDFDGTGFLIKGKRTFLVSGSLHYARVPRALWRDRLLRIKRAGFNTVQTYVFWNFHEPQEGKWDFSGDHDLDAYLKLIRDLGMYAVVRVGPYVCAEWDSGGYPVWLRFKPGVRVREDNPEFEAAVDRYFEKIFPIITANQINHGGAVIMVQLENEHPQGWGTEMPNGYFKHLRDKALALGLEVPYFFSGLHHGSDPAGDRPWDSKGRTNPWYTTEFWPGWYSDYGPLNAGDLRRFWRGTWKILAYGGNGYNFYMLHGGTDFDTWNDDEVASSYDYGGAIGQAGDLRPIYYRFKKAALFARSFADILEDSRNSTDTCKDAATGDGVRVTARTAPAGTILFLDNNGNAPVTTQIKGEGGALFPSAGPLTLAPGEIVPIVTNYKLLPNVNMKMAAARILGIQNQGDNTTLVIYGQAGAANQVAESAEIQFEVPKEGVTVVKGAPALALDPASPGHLSLKLNLFGNPPDEYTFTVGNREVRILAVTASLADRTWFVEASGRSYVVSGPDYVGDVDVQDGKLHVVAEQGWNAEKSEVTAYGVDQVLHMVMPASGEPEEPPFLGAWEVRKADAEARPGFYTVDWKSSPLPLAMGADGDISAYAWYRTTVFAPKAGNYMLQFSDAGDWLTAFVNGKRAASSKVEQKSMPRDLNVPLKAGENTLAILTAHYGRPKLFSYLGPIDTVDAKGIAGPVTLSQGSTASTDVARWRWKADVRGEASAAEMAAGGSGPAPAGWTDVTVGQKVALDVFNGKRGFVWYRTWLSNVPGPHRRLHFESVDDNGTVYLNGKRLFHHEGWNTTFDVPLDSAWKAGGPNILAVLVENTAGPGGIMGPVILEARTGEDTPIRGWKMRGGLGDPAGKSGDWHAVEPTGAGVPAFYRTEFTATPPPETGPHLILRVSLAGMSRGFVWLNGHNLGRYPEKVAVDGHYLPECWLKPGKNNLLIFDEEGNAPTQVKLRIEEPASRNVVALEGSVPSP